MRKPRLPLITPMLLTMFLATACADQGDGDETAEQTKTTAGKSLTANAAGESTSLMDQPVDFSSPEKAEEYLQKIRTEAGEAAFQQVNNAMSYLLFYDLSVGNDKKKLYAKLNGMTPNEIVSSAKR